MSGRYSATAAITRGGLEAEALNRAMQGQGTSTSVRSARGSRPWTSASPTFGLARTSMPSGTGTRSEARCARANTACGSRLGCRPKSGCRRTTESSGQTKPRPLRMRTHGRAFHGRSRCFTSAGRSRCLARAPRRPYRMKVLRTHFTPMGIMTKHMTERLSINLQNLMPSHQSVRGHSTTQVEKLAPSIDAQGFAAQPFRLRVGGWRRWRRRHGEGRAGGHGTVAACRHAVAADRVATAVDA